MTDAAREATTLKAQFRRDDDELCRQGRGAEVLADRMKNLGVTGTGRTRLLTVNGVTIGSWPGLRLVSGVSGTGQDGESRSECIHHGMRLTGKGGTWPGSASPSR
jgi:hypothetical protein